MRECKSLCEKQMILSEWLGRVLSRVFEGQKLPPKMPSFPPKKYCHHYISSYIGKIIQTRRGQCTHCNISQNRVSNAPDCISAHIYCKIFPDPPRKRVAFGHSGITVPSPPPNDDKSYCRQNPAGYPTTSEHSWLRRSRLYPRLLRYSACFF